MHLIITLSILAQLRELLSLSLLYVEKGLLFEPYHGSFNESPALPSYPSISSL